jgi:hypothetical protein
MLDQLQTYPKLVLLASVLVSVYTIWEIRRRRQLHNLPPGPKGIPFFGNLFQLSMRPWNELEAWGKEFGELTSGNDEKAVK